MIQKRKHIIYNDRCGNCCGLPIGIACRLLRGASAKYDALDAGYTILKPAGTPALALNNPTLGVTNIVTHSTGDNDGNRWYRT